MPIKKKETTEEIKERKLKPKETEGVLGKIKDIQEENLAIAAENMKKENEESKNIIEEESGDREEGKHKKKKEIKKLSEKELRRVMTDTKETIVPLTDYISCSVHLGTKVITPDMRKFVYKRRADGLAVLNTNLIDDKLREAAKYIKDFKAEDIFIVCKREAGWPAVERFSEVTGIKCFCKKYPAGIITNLQLETFFEAKLAIVCDPWVDKNALNDALKLKLSVLGICDTNNYTAGVSQIVPANNKSRKSIGLVLFVLAREYLKANGRTQEAAKLKLEEFAGKLEEVSSVSDNYEAKASESMGEVVAEGV